MAHSDKNIVITPNIGSSSSDPQIVFSGADESTGPQNITLKAYPTNSGTLSFEGSAGQLFSITNSLTGTLFSVNDVSGIPSIEVLSTGIVKLAEFSGFVAYGVSPSVSAAGTTQGTATSITRPISVVSTVTAAVSDGVIMPTATAGTRIIIINTSAATLKVYPATSGQINALGTNAAYSMSAGSRLEFIATSTTQWYTINATFA